MHRTIVVRLDPSPLQAVALAETSRLFTAAFNAVAAHGWQHGEKNGVRLHHATYYPLRAAYPALVSDLHIQARMKATEAVKSVLTRQKKGRRVSCPRSVSCPPRFNLHTFMVDWQSHTVRMSTTAGRQTIRFFLPAYATRYAGCATDTADLLYRRGRWYLHIAVTIAAPEITSIPTVVGVDLGITRTAVTSLNTFYGDRRWRELEARDFRLRRALQRKGSTSARRHLRRLSGHTTRRHRDHDHVVSRRVVDATPAGASIAVENLTNIRSRVRAKRANGNQRRLHSWSFATLRAYIEYKAEARGIAVVGVDPRHTSQSCSRCGDQHRSNRRTQSEFRCRSCSFSLNADLNAARNIAAKLLAKRGSTVLGGQRVNLPIAGDDVLHRLPASHPF